MKTKHYLYTLALACMSLGSTSCTDILDVEPLNSFSDEAIWSDLALSETYLNAQYVNLWAETMKGTRFAHFTDEVYQKHTYGSENVTQGLLNCDTYSIGWDETMWDPWGTYYGYIKSINLFLEHIDEVPGDEEWKNWQKGQALFLRAWNYHMLYSLYGRVPLIDHTFGLNDQFEESRADMDDVAAFIVKDCDDAASLLPDVYPDNSDFGRATKGAALALKSRVLLYQASPLFGTPSPEKWQAAADAAHAVFDLNIYHLQDINTSNVVTDPKTVSDEYGALFLDPENPEVIFEKLYDPQYGAGENMSYLYQAPCGIGNGFQGWGNFNPTQEIADFFQNSDGSDFVPQAEYWAAAGDMPDAWKGREPRFYAAFILDGDMWGYGDGRREVEVFRPGESGVTAGRDSDQGEYYWNASNTGYSMRKFLDPNYNSAGTTMHTTPWFFIRLSEIYLNYAECQIQLGNIEGAEGAREYINKVRRRVGLPEIQASDDIWDAYYYERQAELVFEGQRWFDLRRWKQMEECYSHPVTGIVIYKYADGHKQYYTGNTVSTRNFAGVAGAEAHYWLPVPRYELRRSPAIDAQPYE